MQTEKPRPNLILLHTHVITAPSQAPPPALHNGWHIEGRFQSLDGKTSYVTAAETHCFQKTFFHLSQSPCYRALEPLP